MKKTIYYIGHYVDKELENDLIKVNYSGSLKMQYVKDMIKKAGAEVQVVSLFAKTKRVNVKQFSTHYFWSIPSSNKYIAYINRLIIGFQLKMYLLFRVPKYSNIVLYHSYLSTHIFNKISRFKKFNAIIEVEEVYGFSASGHKKYLAKELSDLKKFDCAIFVNDYLPKELDFLNKKYVISYGVHIKYNPRKSKFNDGMIHAVYAGTLAQSKMGAYSAVKASAFLPDNYQVDIYGFGITDSVNKLVSYINEINQQAGFEKVRYMGFLSGNELLDELSRYDIGLSTNIMDYDFVNNSFPSKTITYMSLGLSVVSGYAEAFDGIELTKKWSFFHTYEPKAIAEAICDYRPCTIEENQALLTKIDQNLIDFLKSVFCE